VKILSRLTRVEQRFMAAPTVLSRQSRSTFVTPCAPDLGSKRSMTFLRINAGAFDPFCSQRYSSSNSKRCRGRRYEIRIGAHFNLVSLRS
jgi:hypothetical protein